MCISKLSSSKLVNFPSSLLLPILVKSITLHPVGQAQTFRITFKSSLIHASSHITLFLSHRHHLLPREETAASSFPASTAAQLQLILLMAASTALTFLCIDKSHIVQKHESLKTFSSTSTYNLHPHREPLLLLFENNTREIFIKHTSQHAGPCSRPSKGFLLHLEVNSKALTMAHKTPCNLDLSTAISLNNSTSFPLCYGHSGHLDNP